MNDLFHTPLALLVIVPEMDAIRTMLPPLPNLDICLPAACAVNRTPLTFTLITY